MNIALHLLALVAIGGAIAATTPRMFAINSKASLLWVALIAIGYISFMCLFMSLVMLTLFQDFK